MKISTFILFTFLNSIYTKSIFDLLELTVDTMQTLKTSPSAVADFYQTIVSMPRSFSSLTNSLQTNMGPTITEKHLTTKINGYVDFLLNILKTKFQKEM